MMGFYLAIVVLLGLAVNTVVGRIAGAPSAACSTITPAHGLSPATGAVPYTVNISSLADGYIPGQSYTIVLSGSSTNADFRGFLVQGRVMADETATGTFMNNGDNQQLICADDTSVTHVNNDDKTMVQLMWNAPPMGTGTILFRYAFVDIYTVYWGNQPTNTVNEVAVVTSSTVTDNTVSTIISTTTTSSANTSTTSLASTSTTSVSTTPPASVSTTPPASVSTTPPASLSVSTTPLTSVSSTPSTSMSTMPSATSTPSVSVTPTVGPDGGGATGVMGASSLMLMLLVSIISLIN